MSGWRVLQLLWRENPLRSALGKRILMWLLLLSLVPLFVSNAIGYLASSRIIRGLVARDLAALTSVQAHHVRDEVERLHLLLATAARGDRLLVASAEALRDPKATPVVQSGASGIASEVLDRLRQQLGVFTTIELVFPSGVVVAASPRFGSGVRWRDAELLAGARRQGQAFAVERVGTSARPELAFAVALPSTDTALGMVVAARIGSDGIAGALQLPAHLAGAVEGFVVDLTGRPIAVSHPHQSVDYASPLPGPRALRAGTTRYRNAEAQDVLGSVHAVPGYALQFLSEVPVGAALGELRWLRSASALLGAAFVLVVIAVAWIVSRGIVRPVYALVAATERIGQGDLATTVAVAQRDELGLLGQRFNDMAAQLKESAARIGELHREEMHRAEQLATVGELAAGIAHELKTPLLGLAGGLQLYGRRLDPSDTEGHRLIEEMSQRVRRMEAAVQELLNYARPSPARLSRLDLNAIVERALRLVEPRAQRSGVEIRRELSPGLPPVLVDPEQVGQVIVNLALNGIEALGSGGALEIGTRREMDSVQLLVGDTGPGVPPELRERVFRPFFTTKHAGTGLGLAIVHQIVDQHGGTIRLAEGRTGGAQFIVSLPVAELAPGGE